MAEIDAEEVYYSDVDALVKTESTVIESYESVNTMMDGLDKRIKDFFSAELLNIRNANRDLTASSGDVKDVASWLSNVTDSYVETKRSTENIAGGVSASSSTLSSIETNTKAEDNNKLFIDPNFFEELPEKVKKKIIKELKDAGFTDEEIEDIVNGKYPVDKLATEKISAAITDVVKTNPEVAKILQKTVGFDIFDKDGNVDVNKLQFAEIIAGKNLGMDIDLTPGSPFKVHINQLAMDLETINKTNPDIRKEIIEKYGFDIFDDKGNVDQDKLALVRVIDGQDLNDDYDIEKTIAAFKKENNISDNDTKPADTTAPSSSTNTTAPSSSTNTTAPSSSTNTTAPSSSTNTTAPSSSTDTTAPSTDTTPSSTALPSNSVTPIIGENIDDNAEGPFGLEGHKTDGISASVVDGLEDIIDSIDKAKGRIIPKISPFSNGGNSEVSSNKSSAGIIAAASIAAGGAAAGGGILLHKKTSSFKFSGEDWDALGIDYQGIIENLMGKVGFSAEEIETIKTARFKMPTAEMKEHIKKIEKAMDQNPMCDDELLKLYDYSFFDDENKVIEYLLFITMIIDGKNTMDEYNMYNIINESLGDADEADFTYSGINMEDYFDDGPEDEIEDEDIQMYNDPTQKDYDEFTDEPNGELDDE